MKRAFNTAARYFLGTVLALALPTCFALIPRYGWRAPAVCVGVIWLGLLLLSFTIPPWRQR